MRYGDQNESIKKLQKQLNEVRQKILELRKSQEPEKVSDYEFTSKSGEKVKLSQLFGDKKELFVVHNMGKKCRYCTLWADGFNGIVDHLQNRAAFVVSTPDTPETQKEFASSRGWKFPMVSTQGTSFATDMGYQNDKGVQPGISVFVKSGDRILRVSDTEFGPGDDYCQFWTLVDLLPEGVGDWEPKYSYT
jgi:predicted dithiol-disulfide oxidoreductase (DUF899 family)